MQAACRKFIRRLDQSCYQKPALSPLRQPVCYAKMVVAPLLNVASHCEWEYKTYYPQKNVGI